MIPWLMLAASAVAFIWKAAVDYTKLKDLQENMVTQSDVQEMLKDFVTKESLELELRNTRHALNNEMQKLVVDFYRRRRQ